MALKEIYHVFVDGIPQPQSRPRKGKYGNIYSPTPANGWKEAVQVAFLRNRKPILRCPIILTITCYFPKEGHNGKDEPHTQKPDKDNLEKAIMDALNKLVWEDDSQVYSGRTAKYWSSDKCGAEIWIEVLE
jgi:Holliday junction resolvase RusA-like endonuclease